MVTPSHKKAKNFAFKQKFCFFYCLKSEEASGTADSEEITDTNTDFRR